MSEVNLRDYLASVFMNIEQNVPLSLPFIHGTRKRERGC